MTKQQGGSHTPGAWGIFRNYRHAVYPVVRETEQCVFYRDGSRERRAYREKMVAKLDSEDAATILAERLNSVDAEVYNRERKARIWGQDEKARLIAKARPEPSRPPYDEEN